MPRSGPNGTYSLPPVYLAVPGTTILVDQHNTPLEDIASTFNTATPIDYGGTGATSVAGAKAALGYLYQSWAAYPTAGGTADALTLTPTNALLALATGVPMTFTAASANTGAATIDVSGLGAKAIRKISGGADVALGAADIAAGESYQLRYDTAANAAAGAWVLVSPPTVITQPNLTLKQASAPAPTAEGAIQWDTDDNAIIVGDGSSQAAFYKAATAAEMEAQTAKRAVTADLAHRSPSAAKAWAQFNPAASVLASFNITSVTDNGTGYWTVNIATDFSSGQYAGFAFGGQKSGGTIQLVYNTNSIAAGTFNIYSSEANTAATGADPGNPDAIMFVAFGDQS